MNTIHTPNNTKRSLVAAVIAAGGVAAAMLLGGPVAHADGKSDVQIACEKAGGVYTATTSSVESCCFKEAVNDAGQHCKIYVLGELSGYGRELDPTSTTPKPGRVAQLPAGSLNINKA